MEALEELFIEVALVDLLLSLHYRSVKTELTHRYPQKTKCSFTTAVLRAITAPQAKHLVQLDISYETLWGIRCVSSTDADFGKVLAGRSTKTTSLREVRGRDPNLRSRASSLMATPPFLLPTSLSESHHISKRNHQFGKMG